MKTPLEFIWDAAHDIGKLLSVLCLTMFGLAGLCGGLAELAAGSIFNGIVIMAVGISIFILARLNADHYWKGK